MTPKQIISRFDLSRIEINVTASAAVAKAFPSSLHPIVQRRREEGIKALGAGASIQAVNEVVNKALGEMQVTIVNEPEIDRALEALVADLKRLEAERRNS